MGLLGTDLDVAARVTVTEFGIGHEEDTRGADLLVVGDDATADKRVEER